MQSDHRHLGRRTHDREPEPGFTPTPEPEAKHSATVGRRSSFGNPQVRSTTNDRKYHFNAIYQHTSPTNETAQTILPRAD